MHACNRVTWQYVHTCTCTCTCTHVELGMVLVATALIYNMYLAGNFSNKISLIWVFKRQIAVSIDDQLPQESAMFTDLLCQFTSVNACRDKTVRNQATITLQQISLIIIIQCICDRAYANKTQELMIRKSHES